MSKKNRARKVTSYICVEGKREQEFIDFLRYIYVPDENGVAFYPEMLSGGTPDSIVKHVITKCDRDKSLAWFDEDFEPNNPLSADMRQSLAKQWNIIPGQLDDFMVCPLKDLQKNFNISKRKPILVVSNPVCIESFILIVLQKSLPFYAYDPKNREVQIRSLKNSLDGHLGNKKLPEFLKENLTKSQLEILRSTNQDLDYLIKMVTK